MELWHTVGVKSVGVCALCKGLADLKPFTGQQWCQLNSG